MSSQLKIASDSDIETIVSLLCDMQDEVKELKLDKDIVRQSVLRSMSELVCWFIFIDEKEKVFGTCYLQSVHNYWTTKRRYYLGGFYIAPSHRKQGRFKELNQQLKEWAIKHDGVQIYCHIHEDNDHSLNSFSSVGMLPTEYKYCVHYWWGSS